MRLAVILAALLAAAPAGAGTCPQNTISVGCWPDGIGQTGDIPAARYGQAGSFEAWSAGQQCQYGCYDLSAGVLVAVGRANTQGGCLAGVNVTDVYTLVGPAGPALSFEAVLVVDATMAPHTTYYASLDGPGGASQSISGTDDGEVAIPLAIVPGDSFTLGVRLSSAGDTGAYPPGDGIAHGTIRFRGLPEGYSIVSCQNYDLPTPARPSSWGGVKAHYR
jgi:hypothetical protein